MSQAAADIARQREIVNSHITDINQALLEAGIDEAYTVELFSPIDQYADYDIFRADWETIDAQLMRAAERFDEHINSVSPEELSPNAPHIQHVLQNKTDDEMGDLDTLMSRLTA